jgi:outer membrane protein assembly factor BamE (lipoprotein component of BamABCDE complex)
VQSIGTGMTAPQVLARLGAPAGTTRFEQSSTTAWDYPSQGAFGPGEFSAILDDNDIVIGRTVIGQSLKGE